MNFCFGPTTLILWRTLVLAYEASNADEAIALLKLHDDIRAVFTDIQMPRSMDGLKLAHYIRGRWSPVKLIPRCGFFLGNLISLKWSRALYEQCSDTLLMRSPISQILAT
jgi:hypothetical protein